jgi:hypothetical protein
MGIPRDGGSCGDVMESRDWIPRNMSSLETTSNLNANRDRIQVAFASIKKGGTHRSHPVKKTITINTLIIQQHERAPVTYVNLST